MGVYIYQNNSELAMKNAYIGEHVEPGIYHNATLGLISLSSDGNTWVTIEDKNLGATTAYNYGDTLSEANAGKYYQWGNNYGFPFTGGVTTSGSQVNAQNYGPGNYYSSSTFITRSSNPYTRDSSNNNNLWGNTTGTVDAMKGPCSSGFHVPSTDEWVSIIGILTTTFSLATNDTTLGKYLKIPPAGYRYWVNSNIDMSSHVYWSSTPFVNPNSAYSLSFSQWGITTQNINYRSLGATIRPFKNEAVQPDTSRTKLY